MYDEEGKTINTETFVTVLAWIFGLGAAVLTVTVAILESRYTEIDRLRDMWLGIERRFYAFKLLCVAVVCWVWILTR